MITIAEVNDAITTLREFCADRERCEECPLGFSNGECMLLEDRPFTWPNTTDDEV